MKTLISIGSIAIGSIALSLISVQQAQAASIVLNGDFNPAATTPPTTTVAFGNYNALDSSTVTSWNSLGYNFLVPSGNGISTANTPGVDFYGTTFSAPNSANYFIAADGAYQSGRIYQDLTGLTIGDTYSISFYQAAAQQNGFSGATTDNWIVNVGGTYTAPTYVSGSGGGSNTTVDGTATGTPTGGFTGGTTYTSPLMSLGDKANAGTQTTTSGPASVNGWQQDSFAFKATATTERLSFLAQGTPTGKPPFSLLSGVSANKIPEPADYVGTLVGFGFLGFAIKSRLAKKKLEE